MDESGGIDRQAVLYGQKLFHLIYRAQLLRISQGGKEPGHRLYLAGLLRQGADAKTKHQGIYFKAKTIV